VAYFTKRLAQVQYATFQAAGYPIGSGSTESANKVVVEARLKGSGMHGAREHVNPLVALRTVACTDRWAEVWPRLTTRLRAEALQRQRARWQRRHPPPLGVHITPPSSDARPLDPAPIGQRSTTVVNGRPTASHPWKGHRFLFGLHRSLNIRVTQNLAAHPTSGALLTWAANGVLWACSSETCLGKKSSARQ
jgi:hypothetical protein